MRSIAAFALVATSISTIGLIAAQSRTIPELVERSRPQPVYLSRVRELVPPPFAKLVEQSDLIARGVVTPIRTYMSDDQTTLYTDFRLAPSAIIMRRGGAPTLNKPGVIPIVFTQRGGRMRVNGVEVTVQDLNFEALRAGEEVVAFLSKGQQANQFDVVGEIAGVFTVERNHVRSRMGRDVYSSLSGASVDEFVRSILETAGREK